jgi:hypothetical protein
MTIYVKGDSELAKKIRTNLAGTFAMSQTEGTADKIITIQIEPRKTFAFDSIDTPLERAIFRFLRKATPLPIETHTAGGIQNEREVLLMVPAGRESEAAAEKAVQQGFLTLLNHKQIDLSAVPVPVSADQVPQMRALLNEVFTQLCEVLSGTSRDAGREQAKQDYETLSVKLESRLQVIESGVQVAIAKAAADDHERQLERALQAAQFKEEIREMLRVKGERHAGLWARLVAAWKDLVVVVPE